MSTMTNRIINIVIQSYIKILLLGLLTLTACSTDQAPAIVDDAPVLGGGGAITTWTESTELFFEYPAMIAGGPADSWAIHVTRMEDFSPILEGALILAFRSSDGTVFTTRSEAPARPGIYTPSPELPAPGTYDLVVDIEGPSLKDRLQTGQIIVYANESDLPFEDDAPSNSMSFLKEQQWPISFNTAKAALGEMHVSISVSGEIVPAAGRVAEVASPVSGLVIAGENINAPAPGDRVRKGQILITLAPTSQNNSYAGAKAEVERLARESDRLQRLFDAEAIPEKRLIEARYDLELAEAALNAMGGSTQDGYSYPLRAPISGAVQERMFTPGARIEIGQPAYRIVDPRLVYLKLRLPAQYAAVSGSFQSAQFTVEGTDRVYRSKRVVSTGSSIDPASRTLPVIMAVENADESLKIGHVAQASLSMDEVHTGVLIPNSAILKENGLSVAYVQTGGESFERRLLTLGPDDGVFTLVERGVDENDHVVTEGAYQVYLASLNTSEIIDHGHAH